MSKLVIGDLHGQVEVLHKILRERPCVEEVMVAGDFGLGFDQKLDDQYRRLGDIIIRKGLPHVSFIRGNHDNPQTCRDWEQEGIVWYPDGYLEYETLYLGGAKSHDIEQRKEGVDWWVDEELSEEQWDEIFENLKGLESQVKRIISHDAPRSVKNYLKLMNFESYSDTLTSDRMETLLGMLPNLRTWIHGHYHTHHSTRINGVRFIGLAPAHNIPLTSVRINYDAFTYFEEGNPE